MGLNLSPDETLHCRWAPADDPLYRAYHDEEWGVPEYDPRALWEKLQLDGMQAGLSWVTILRKRETIREEFDGFVPERVARWDQERIEKALQNPGIIRSPKKIQATIGNAQAYLDMMDAGEDFSHWLWSFTGGAPIVNQLDDVSNVPAKTPLSEELSKALKKKGFKFCGPVIVYAFMQAVGMVNDHETRCPRHKEVQEFYK
ncbi:DNA-3-methyladenine glycosylase I [Henriciella mobilis]|uniref:DNA-3-methyladenine glycosylase I n=1 Tax=Henriciella mobilis TaxID=2305467 RepID=UPI000E66E68A|nr:DNA-3-methyladenine glycosylase I [Henriciella mobilis]RIJ14896.1 DNA-3-methyladenine glycosylase I [Henriciella mobilis]RIJ21851.1 DNA-3-methyladenine glycosylase I [Henriciella mobilis]